MFFKDFKLNEQQTNLTTFVDGQVVEYAKLFVPGLECCWSIIYEDVKKNKLTVISHSYEEYFQIVEEEIKELFLGFPSAKKEDIEANSKLFSFKRGFPFYIKSNILLVVLLLLLLVNKNSWAADGGILVIFNFLQGELLIIILSILAFGQRNIS